MRQTVKLRIGASLVRWIATAVGMLLVTVLFLALIEGVSSLVLLAGQTRLLSERRHTRYDHEIGWVSLTRQNLLNLYGPGKHLTTNAQGFRGSADVTPEVPPGRRRIICSGDSFTLGVDVGDQSTWCARLATPTIETVNMGQGAYGLDQVYLWYRRAGLPLGHQGHIVAFITEDFRRMARTAFRFDADVYGKPRLILQDGRLIVTNVPVPRRSLLTSWLAAFLRRFERLRFIELATSWGMVRPKPPLEDALSDDAVWKLAAQVFSDFEAWNEGKGSRLILLYLPRDVDYSTAESDPWRQRVGEWARMHGVAYLDLVTAFRRLPGQRIPRMFVHGSPFGRHYSERGNHWVAAQLRPLLEEQPASAARPPAPR